MSGPSIAARVARAVSRASAKVSGDGATLRGTLSRVSGADESTYPPIPGAVTEYSASVGLFAYSEKDRGGTDITARDVRVLVTRPLASAAGAETEPRNGDRLEVAGVTYDIVSVSAEQFGGYPLMWQCQCRAAE